MTFAAACTALENAIAALGVVLETPPDSDAETQQFARTVFEFTSGPFAVGFDLHRMDAFRYFYQDEPGQIDDSKGISTALTNLGHALNDIIVNMPSMDTVRQMGEAGRAALCGAMPAEWMVYVVLNASNADLQPTITDASLFAVLPSAVTDLDVAANQIAEDASEADEVSITAHASDAYSNAFTYSLSDDADGRFAVHPTTGVVTIVDVTDLVADDEYAIVARATRTKDGRYTEASFTITVVAP